MSNTQTLAKTDPERAIEFIPFGAADKIKLSVKIIQNMIAVPTKSGKTCSERDALRFLMLCQAQRLNPFAGDAFLVGYDTQNGPSFSLITAHQAFLKRAETCKEFEGMESGIIIQADDDSITEREGDFYLDGETVVGGWARVHRQGRRDTYRRIRMARFNTGFAQWKVDPAGMICKCAEADALRSTFPTLLGGLYIQGEVDGAADRIVSQMISRPIFEAPAKVEPPQKPATPILDDTAGSDLGPQTGPGEPEAAQSASERQPPASPPQARGNLVGMFRLVLKKSGHSEVELMDFLHSTRGLDDSLGTLSEAEMVARPTIQKAYDEWAQIDKELKKLKEAKK